MVQDITIADLADIQDIAQGGFEERWTDQDFAYFLCHSERMCIGVKQEGRIVAYLLALLTQGDLDIISIATHQNALRQGHGRSLLEAAIERPGVERIFLEVDKENAAALAFYQSMGFEIYLERKGYYGGKRDAWCLKREIRS